VNPGPADSEKRNKNARPDIVERVLVFIEENGLVRPGERILAALSGGGDSVAMTVILKKLEDRLDVEIWAAHADHGLRASSKEDARFSAGLAEKLGIPFKAGKLSIAQRGAESLEESARKERYAFLSRIAREVGAGRIATGHTLNDRVETFLLNLLRGSGTRGLSSLRPLRQDGVIRPLLGETRLDVREFLAKNGIEYREDPTNLDKRFQRNKLRIDVLPELARHFGPKVERNIARAAFILEGEEGILEKISHEKLESLSFVSDQEIWLDLSLLSNLERPMTSRVIISAFEKLTGSVLGLEEKHISVLNMMVRRKQPRRLYLSGNVHAELCAGFLVLRDAAGEVGGLAAQKLDEWKPGINKMDGDFTFSLGFDDTKIDGDKASRRTLLNVFPAKDKLGSLQMRSWRHGDRMHFNLGGTSRTKKISDLFTDYKIPRWRRRAIPILASIKEPGLVFWVPGVRQGNGPWVRPGEGAVRVSLEGFPGWFGIIGKLRFST